MITSFSHTELQTNIKQRTELSTTRFRVSFEKLIDDRVKIHKTSIFSEIILGFAQEHVRLSVATLDGDFPWFCKRFHNFNFVGKF